MTEGAAAPSRRRSGRLLKAVSRTLYYTFKQPLRLYFLLAHGLRVENARRIPTKGGCVVVSNHQSFYDPPLLGVALPRMLIYTPRASLKGSLFYRFVTRGLDLEPVARDGRDVGAARRMIERVRGGEVLVLFPEQTRTPDGTLGTITPGFHMIAAHAPAPVLPVLIEGAFEAWPRTDKRPHWGRRIRVRVGEPLEVKDLKRDEAARRVEAALFALGAKPRASETA